MSPNNTLGGGLPSNFQHSEFIEGKGMEKYETGASRSETGDRPCYRKALSPLVLQGYVEYLGRHRHLPDGTMRDWDNWKSGIPMERALEGLGRHDMSVWLLMHGLPASDNNGPVTLKDSLYGVIFNATVMLHQILLNEQRYQELSL